MLNEEEFRLLIERMRVVEKEEEVLFLLQLVDPFNNQQMTFSELVHLFSSVSGQTRLVLKLISFINLFSTWSLLEARTRSVQFHFLRNS